MGIAVMNSLENGGTFADWKRSFQALDSDQYSPWRITVQ